MTHFSALPLFPLSSQVFPEGRMQLRIFEPRYLRMVAESSRAGTGFAMCMSNSDGEILPLATRVVITDFCQLDNELLGITVEGVERVEITQVEQQSDGLNVGVARARPNWQACDINQELQIVAEQLRHVHQQYQELAALYPKPEYHNGSWVAQRWLEIIPLSGPAKQQLWQNDNPNRTLELLQQMLQQN